MTIVKQCDYPTLATTDDELTYEYIVNTHPVTEDESTHQWELSDYNIIDPYCQRWEIFEFDTDANGNGLEDYPDE